MPVPGKKLKIVTIGGGTGAPIIVKSLLLAGFTNISAITASMDSGGKTGLIRSDERDRIIAISDVLRTLISLIHSKHRQKPNIKALIDLLDYTDGRNRNIGYTLYYGLLEKYQNKFPFVQKHLEKLMSVKFCGQAIPVSLFPTNIHFTTISGSTHSGEHVLDRLSFSKDSVTNIILSPSVPATKEAQQAIKEATHIIYCPGSLYGSIIANFLPLGIKESLKQSAATKILITNLTSTRNQTHRFTPIKYFNTFKKYTKLSIPFDVLISPNLSTSQFNQKHPKIKTLYQNTHSHFLGWTKKQLLPLRKKAIKVVTSNIYSITPKLGRLRHDPKKLAKILKTIIK
jgi:uncharacterized cofD-like protein